MPAYLGYPTPGDEGVGEDVPPGVRLDRRGLFGDAGNGEQVRISEYSEAFAVLRFLFFVTCFS